MHVVGVLQLQAFLSGVVVCGRICMRLCMTGTVHTFSW
jgi:hypothetical protein